MTFPEIQLELHGKFTGAPYSASTTMLQLTVADVDNAATEAAQTNKLSSVGDNLYVWVYVLVHFITDDIAVA